MPLKLELKRNPAGYYPVLEIIDSNGKQLDIRVTSSTPTKIRLVFDGDSEMKVNIQSGKI